MKKQVLNFRKAMLVAALVSVTSLSATAAPASSKNDKSSKTAQHNIQYVGTTDAGVVFNVKYDNTDSAKFDLIIKNGYGEVVYQQAYSDVNFDKKVMLLKEPGDAHLTFIIRTADNDYKQSFDITTVTRTVEDIMVKNSK
jgi:hypothetical protein